MLGSWKPGSGSPPPPGAAPARARPWVRAAAGRLPKVARSVPHRQLLPACRRARKPCWQGARAAERRFLCCVVGAPAAVHGRRSSGTTAPISWLLRHSLTRGCACEGGECEVVEVVHPRKDNPGQVFMLQKHALCCSTSSWSEQVTAKNATALPMPGGMHGAPWRICGPKKTAPWPALPDRTDGAHAPCTRTGRHCPTQDTLAHSGSGCSHAVAAERIVWRGMHSKIWPARARGARQPPSPPSLAPALWPARVPRTAIRNSQQ
jgi:hypothetical protein